MTTSNPDNAEIVVSEDGRQRLAAIEERDGVITREEVLRDAERLDSPLRKFFTWDDQKAAQAYRLQQAEAIIRSYYYTPIPGGPRIREYVYAPSLSGYVSTEKVRHNPTLQQDVFKKLQAELDALISRNRNFEKVVPALQPLLDELDAFSKKFDEADTNVKRPKSKPNKKKTAIPVAVGI